MIWRSECTWHAHDPAMIEIEFQTIPGPIVMRISTLGGLYPTLIFYADGQAYFTKNNQIRCDSGYGPVVGYLDIEQRAVKMRFFPYMGIAIPDRWHILPEEL